MIVYVNRKPHVGPWGGGNKTLSGICENLTSLGHSVVFNLQENIDVILCFDPRPDSSGIWYQHLYNYKQKFNTPIVHRVGDLGTHSKPELYDLVKQTIPHSSHVVFPSQWALEYSDFKGKNYSIIPNRPRSIFYENRDINFKSTEKLKAVTHHWSNNPMKGFDVYSHIDKNLADILDFTYIGRVPESFSFARSKYIPPVDDREISKLLPKNDFYLTASRQEAGANHVLEALAAGLPVIYHEDGGSIGEYVGNHGIPYSDQDSLYSAILDMKENLESYKANLKDYSEDIQQTIDQYCEIICQTI
tara:strand:- start:5628 stop:6536 length:909 start_codon:yes stop_codon:yes gene_type:complete